MRISFGGSFVKNLQKIPSGYVERMTKQCWGHCVFRFCSRFCRLCRQFLQVQFSAARRQQINFRRKSRADKWPANRQYSVDAKLPSLNHGSGMVTVRFEAHCRPERPFQKPQGSSELSQTSTGVGAQSTLGRARHFCPKIHAWKINKMPEFYMIYAEKYFSRIWGGELPSPAPRLLRPCKRLRSGANKAWGQSEHFIWRTFVTSSVDVV